VQSEIDASISMYSYIILPAKGPAWPKDARRIKLTVLICNVLWTISLSCRNMHYSMFKELPPYAPSSCFVSWTMF